MESEFARIFNTLVEEKMLVKQPHKSSTNILTVYIGYVAPNTAKPSMAPPDIATSQEIVSTGPAYFDIDAMLGANVDIPLLVLPMLVIAPNGSEWPNLLLFDRRDTPNHRTRGKKLLMERCDPVGREFPHHYLIDEFMTENYSDKLRAGYVSDLTPLTSKPNSVAYQYLLDYARERKQHPSELIHVMKMRLAKKNLQPPPIKIYEDPSPQGYTVYVLARCPSCANLIVRLLELKLPFKIYSGDDIGMSNVIQGLSRYLERMKMPPQKFPTVPIVFLNGEFQPKGSQCV